MTLSCDHIGCPNGCTTLAGMCEACVQKVLAEQRERIEEIIRQRLCRSHARGAQNVRCPGCQLVLAIIQDTIHQG